MTRSQWLLGGMVLAALTTLSGAIQGRMSHRFSQPADIDTAARLLEQIPHEFGPWEMEASTRLDEPTLQKLECAGHVLRRYVHRTTGARVQVAVMLGPPGPMAVHTPDVCYPSREYLTVQDMQRVGVQAGTAHHEFWAMTLERRGLDGGLLRVYHAWSTGREWSAPAGARFHFAASRYLYKIQLAGDLPNLSVAGTADDPGYAFLAHFVEAAERSLAPPDTH